MIIYLRKFICILPLSLMLMDLFAFCVVLSNLYGLKQSPRAWYEQFQDVALQIDF